MCARTHRSFVFYSYLSVRPRKYLIYNFIIDYVIDVGGYMKITCMNFENKRLSCPMNREATSARALHRARQKSRASTDTYVLWTAGDLDALHTTAHVPREDT